MSTFTISTEKSKLDIETIHDFLSNRSYWANGRRLETIRDSIDHSLCFGVYDEKNKMVGFARVVTDYAVFAYIMDIFILEDYRTLGLGKKLMDYIMNYPILKKMKRVMLGTKDAHKLYEKFGFKILAEPEKFMEIVNKSHT